MKIMVYRPRRPRQSVIMNMLFNAEPLELEYLYTVLKDYGEILLLDHQVRRIDIAREIIQFKPDLLLITAMITQVNEVNALALRVSKLPSPPKVFIGGPHAEVMPEHFFTPGVDVVFHSGQLDAVSEVIDLLLRGESYHQVAGIAWKKEGAFIRNPFRPSDPAAMPIPDRPLLNRYQKKYRFLYYRHCATMKASFGCPEQCTFCFCREMNGGRYASRPIPEVMKEIETIPSQNIFFVDDNFLLGVDRLHFFCDEIKRRNIRKKFIVYGTTGFIARHPEVMRRLKEAGLSAVIAGFEFIRDSDLQAFQKGSDAGENRMAIDICHTLDLDLVSLFMVSPEWKSERFRELARYVSKNRLYLATFGTITTLPGTKLWEETRRTAPDHEKWWRYDLVRLHERPDHMPAWMYYFRLSYLYTMPAFSPGGLRYYFRRAGVAEALRIAMSGIYINIDFLIRLLRWH